ncbi:hypothetical protein O0L34_g15188 [Tuta absoluta]|nr:hypothetical protein O0L34_g15188 [Tuta absoluta]
MSSGAIFGILTTFDHKTQEWAGYKARLNQWFIANDIGTTEADKAKVKRRAILLSALSGPTYKIASNLALPKTLEETEFEDILKLLDGYFTPKRSGFADRFHFYSAVQQPGEGHAQWAARIRGLAEHCEFQSLEETLVDHFLMGMVAGHERDKLYALNPRDLTLAKAVEQAESTRCAREAAKATQAPARFAPGSVHLQEGSVFKISKGEKCSVCGYASHKADQCRLKAYKCKKCGLKGHLRRMCSTAGRVHYIEDVDEGDDAYNYKIEYIRSSDNSADYLSRSSYESWDERDARAREGAQGDLRDCEERAAYVNFMVQGCLPVTMQELRSATDNDVSLCRVKKFIINGWPRKVSDDSLKPFHICRTELSVENGVVMRGHKAVIPKSLQSRICDELHSSHFGIVKMKAEARARLWFPGVDAALERLAAACEVCAQLRPSPPRAPLASWPIAPHAFHRCHLDFLGPFNNMMFLIVVDAYSKWVECYEMPSSYGSKAVIEKLCDMMSRVGIPNIIVSDNGTSFTSQEFRNFCTLNGIRQYFSPAYHPASNGQAESFVKIIKRGLKAIILESTNKKNLKEEISKFLFNYRNSKNGTTGKSPAELVYGHTLRSRLDLIKPTTVASASTDLTQYVEQKQCSQAKYFKSKTRPNLELDDKVWVKKFSSNQRFSWMKGVITGKVGKMLYLVFLTELNTTVTRHIDQIWTKIERENDLIQQKSDSQANHSQALQEDYAWDPDIVTDVLPLAEVPNLDNSQATGTEVNLSTGEEEASVLESEPSASAAELSTPGDGEALLESQADVEISTPTSTSGDELEPGFSTPENAAIVVTEPDPIQLNPRPKRNRNVVDYKTFF